MSKDTDRCFIVAKKDPKGQYTDCIAMVTDRLFDARKKANSLNKAKGKPVWGVFEAINNAKEFFINKGVVMNG